MIVIVSPNAKSAALSVDLKHPPVLTVKAQYGSYTCEGTKYTSSLTEDKPCPCLDESIPALGDNDVVFSQVFGSRYIRRSSESKWQFPSRRSLLARSVQERAGSEPNDPDLREKYQGILQWLEENNPLNEDEVDFIDVTEFCHMAFSFIREAVLDGFLAKRMGKARIYLRDKLDQSTFHKEYSSGLLCRKTEGPFVNDLFRESRVVCSYNSKDRTITVSSKED